MADVNVQAILGNPPKPVDPLTQISGWQDYANKVAQGAQIRQETKTSKQALSQKMVTEHNQDFVSILATPEADRYRVAREIIDRRTATGGMDKKTSEVLGKLIDQHKDNPAALGQLALRGLVGNLSGPEALKALNPQIDIKDIGGHMLPTATTSPVQQLQGVPPGVSVLPGGFNKTQPPGYLNSGNQQIPVGGGLGTPTINQGLTPEQATNIQGTWQQDANGNWVKRQETVGGANPGLAPPAMRQGGGPLGAGGYGGPKPVDVPIETEKRIEQGQTAYTEDQKSVPALQGGVTSLTKALHSLNNVATGKGTNMVQLVREYVTSLANFAGVDIGFTGDQAADRAKIDKFLTEYARSGGLAGRSVEHLQAAMSANPSGEISNAAAQDIVRQLIGKDRQAIAAVQGSPGAQGHLDSKNKTVTSTDPRGFAWDQYTKAQQDEIIKKAKGSKGEDSEDFKKLMRGIAIANRQKMFTAPPPANVNENR